MAIEVSGGFGEVVPKFKKKMRDKKAHAFTKQMIKRGIVADPNAPMAGTHSQPSTAAYRTGWDRIFGKPCSVCGENHAPRHGGEFTCDACLEGIHGEEGRDEIQGQDSPEDRRATEDAGNQNPASGDSR